MSATETETEAPPRAPQAEAKAPKREIFRSVALERLSSPEQLDQLMQVTTPRGWLLLLGVGLLLATALVWSVVGSIPERIAGHGILTRSGGVLKVEAPGEGRVIDVAVRVGDDVKQGQVVARIERLDLALLISQARSRLHDARARHEQQRRFGEQGLRLQGAALAQRREQLRAAIAAGESTLRTLDEGIATQQELLRQGLITRRTLQEAQQERDRFAAGVRQSRSDLAALDVEGGQVRNQAQQAAQESESAVLEAEREVTRLENELRTTTAVTSPYTGRVLELLAEQGSEVVRGQPILTVALDGRTVKGLEAVIYIPSVHGKKIRPGMDVQIAPTTVKKEEFGYLMGTVTYVSDFPVTSQGMMRVFNNEQLVSTLSGDDAPYEIHVDLLPDPDNVSTYRWTSSEGPPLRIQSGTLASAGVVVERRRPIEMIIPPLRRRAEASSRRRGVP